MKTRSLVICAVVVVPCFVLGLDTEPCAAGVVCPDDPNCTVLVGTEARYIVACQDVNLAGPAYGAINNVYGKPTWVVPSENAMAILGLVMATEILQDPNCLAHAQRAADYLVSVQDSSDGAWYNQYRYATPDINDLGKSPRHTAEVMIALNKLGYDPNRYDAMSKGASYLMDCQAVANKGGRDDGLLGGGKDGQGKYQGWRWTHDNAYGYWALRAAEVWASRKHDDSFAETCAIRADTILGGINAYLYDATTGVWHVAIDGSGTPQWPSSGLENLPSWIQYAPQMLDLPAHGVNSPRVGEWIHRSFQRDDGSCISFEREAGQFKTRQYPGYSFQAALCWLDAGHTDYATSAVVWCRQSGLWQVQPDGNNQTGGWVDWVEVEPNSGSRADWWVRFIDTSFYAIAAFHGGYDFRVR